MEAMAVQRKRSSELDYWRKLYGELTAGAADPAEALMAVSRDRTFPRYLHDLRLAPDSFRGRTVLEVACGPNGGLHWFQDCRRIGVDELIDDYRRIGYPLWLHDIEYLTSRAESMPLEDASIDAVVMTNALDHVENPQAVVGEIRRVLRPGGAFHLDVNYQYKSTTCEPHVFSDEAMAVILGRWFEYRQVEREDLPAQRLTRVLLRCKAI